MKKSRKRLLISSVAMLLVAMLALGTATFAWFTQSTTASADQISVKATKASSLEISKSDHDWTTSFSYGFGSGNTFKKLIPASTADGTNWFTANAAQTTASTADNTTISDATVTFGATNGIYGFADQLNIKNSGSSGSITNVTVTVSFAEGTTASDYARIALVPCASSEANTKGTEAEGAFKTHVYAKTADASGSPTKALKAKTGSELTEDVTAKSWSAIDLADTALSYTTTLAPEAEQYYNLYVWFEGQDPDCKDANIGEVLNSLVFTVAGTPANS